MMSSFSLRLRSFFRSFSAAFPFLLSGYTDPNESGSTSLHFYPNFVSVFYNETLEKLFFRQFTFFTMLKHLKKATNSIQYWGLGIDRISGRTGSRGGANYLLHVLSHIYRKFKIVLLTMISKGSKLTNIWRRIRWKKRILIKPHK